MLYASWLPNSIIQSCSYKRQAENLCAYVIFHEKEGTLYFTYLNLWKRAKIFLKLYQILWIDTVRAYITYNVEYIRHIIFILSLFGHNFLCLPSTYIVLHRNPIVDSKRTKKCWINCVIFIRLNHQFSLDWWPSIWVIISIFVIDEYKTFLLSQYKKIGPHHFHNGVQDKMFSKSFFFKKFSVDFEGWHFVYQFIIEGSIYTLW